MLAGQDLLLVGLERLERAVGVVGEEDDEEDGVGVADEAGVAGVVDGVEGVAGGGDLVVIFAGSQGELDSFGVRLARDHGLGALARVTAPDAVAIAGRAGLHILDERAILFSAMEGEIGSTRISLHSRQSDRRVRDGRLRRAVAARNHQKGKENHRKTAHFLSPIAGRGHRVFLSYGGTGRSLVKKRAVRTL